MFIIGLTGIARTTCIETTGKMPVANHVPNLCPHHQRQDRAGYGGVERKTQQRLQGHAVIRHDSGIPYPVIYFRRQGIKHRRWKYARPCESLEGRALGFPSPAFCWSHVDLQRDVITGNFDMESQWTGACRKLWGLAVDLDCDSINQREWLFRIVGLKTWYMW